MKRLVLHIGPHKTGTTYLQNRLLEHQAALNNHGASYPDAFFQLKGHHLLYRYLVSGSFDHEFRRDLKEIKKSQGIVILSSENFSLLTESQIKEMGRIFEGIPTKIIYYYRTPSQRLISMWQEDIKHGATISFFEYYLNHVSKPFASEVLNASITLDRYAREYGADSLAIIDYDRAFQSATMLNSLLEAAEIDLRVKEDSKIFNKMIDLTLIEIIRGLNLLAKQDGRLHGYNVRNAFWSLMPACEQEITELRDIHSTELRSVTVGNCYYDRALLNHLKDRYKQQLGDFSFTPTGKEYLMPGANWLSAKGAWAVLNQIYEKFSSTLYQRAG